MSTDRQRLKSAIQRIAEQSPAISAAIGDSKNKGGQESSTGVGISDADRDRLCCDGSDGGNANAGSSARDTDDGGGDGLDSNDPANIDIGSGSLTGVTDCATGQPICFDGGGFIAPDGWNDPQQPPAEEGYAEGTFWVANVEDGASPSQPCSALHASGGYPGSFAGYELNFPTSGKCYYGVLNSSGVLVRQAFSGVSRNDCPAPPGSDACDREPVREEAWPEDGCTNLAIENGQLVGSRLDPENDGSYSAPRDELEVCDSSGNRILLRGSPTGGWKSIKSLSGDIDPDTGNGYLYRPNGQRIRQISPSEFRDDTV